MNTKKYPSEPKKQLIDIEHADISNDITTCTPNYSMEVMNRLRNQLNLAKSKLDKYYNGRDKRNWLYVSGYFDLYKSMRNKISQTYNAQLVSNAWLKYYEIYSYWNMFADGNTTAFFNAELPGAALCAYNHYVNTMLDARSDAHSDTPSSATHKWYASSLVDFNDGTTTAFEDTYGLVRRNPDNWLMSGTNNGDATSVSNLRDFQSRIGSTVNFYSHDAGMDVSGDFNAQESTNAKLHLGCAIAGFLTMAPGATFVAKQYTCMETLTWNLIIIYATLFDKFYMFKPVTSRPYNSEIYLIGFGYKGISESICNKLLYKLEHFDMSPLLHLDCINIKYLSAYNSIYAFAKSTFTTQIEYLDESIYLYEKYKNNQRALIDLCTRVGTIAQNEWFNKHLIKKIDRDRWLPADKNRI